MSNPLSEDFFRHLCLHTGVAMVATDAQLRIRFWNPAAARIFGRPAEAMLGEPITSIVPPERLRVAHRLFERVLHQGQMSEFEFRHDGPAGTPRYLAVSIAPVVDESDECMGVCAYLRNVTRRIESERATAEAQKMSALGSMAGAVAHHFNNLLAGLITTADFSQNSDDPKILRRALQAITSTLTRASKLTLALLAFAEGEHHDDRTEDVTAIVQRFVADLEPSLRETGITIEADLQPIDCRLPAKQVVTILDSLTSNACDAMPAGGILQVELALIPDGRNMVLRIGDTGPGISENDLGRVFEPFFTTKAAEPTGLADHPGLGLAIVHGIVRSLGGTVTLCSSRTDGTICSVQLPCLAASSRFSGSPAADPP